jgi:CopG family transcriptional regulator, nickel-responsive regulator
MPIVSLSFPEQMIKEMDQIQKSGGFAGRSELVRSAIRLLFENTRDKSALTGHMNAILVVTHDESNEAPITKLKHEFEDIVKTHIHSKISPSNCVELFLLEGEGKKIGAMSREFQKEDKLRSVKLVAFD